jgi:hypothetical protein
MVITVICKLDVTVVFSEGHFSGTTVNWLHEEGQKTK